MTEADEASKRAGTAAAQAELNAKKAGDLVATITDLVAKATEAQAKADNEALRANQAKLMVEDHSNAVAKLKGIIEANASAVATTKAELESNAQLVTNLVKSCQSDVTSISDARKTADETSKATSEISGKAAVIQARIEEISKTVDTLHQTVKANSASSDTNATHITSAKKTSDDLLAAIQKTNVSSAEIYQRVKTSLDSIETVEKESKEKLVSLDGLVQKLQEVENNVLGYEANLKRMGEAFDETLQKVEQLLPGATSASLASSFCSQKLRFKKPQLAWMITFFVCIGLLLISALVGGMDKIFVSGESSWDPIWRHLAQRLPFVVPLVWLGVYSGRQYMTSLRMEEEYAFKEATSTAFEGYKREMISIPGITVGGVTPINILCENVLSSLSRRPGLIYEGGHQDITPLTPAFDAAEKLARELGKVNLKNFSLLKPVEDAAEKLAQALPEKGK